jgi:hypothetical protein
MVLIRIDSVLVECVAAAVWAVVSGMGETPWGIGNEKAQRGRRAFCFYFLLTY